MLGAHKLCAIPININQRYVEEEPKYLIDNADLDAIFHHKQYSNKLQNIKSLEYKVRAHFSAFPFFRISMQ